MQISDPKRTLKEKCTEKQIIPTAVSKKKVPSSQRKQFVGPTFFQYTFSEKFL
jgi:hypothetical protein